MRRRSRRAGTGQLRFATRRPRRLRASLVAVALVAAGSLAAHASVGRDGDDGPPVADGPRATVDRSEGTDRSAGADADLQAARDAAAALAGDGDAPGIPELPESAGLTASPLLGRLGGVEVHLPSADPVVVGFHEAATVSALAVRPVGSLAEDRNTTRTDLPPDDAAGASYLVLSSRGRVAAPTSAVDVVLRDDDPVLAAVTGTVVDVRSYLLYGSHQDQRIEIVPAGRDDVRVVMIHVAGAQVEVGDVVIGGVTPVAASVRRFPFGSQIDRETEPERFGHVHLEVQPLDAPRFGDEDPDGEDPDGEDADGEDADGEGGARGTGNGAGTLAR